MDSELDDGGNTKNEAASTDEDVTEMGDADEIDTSNFSLTQLFSDSDSVPGLQSRLAFKRENTLSGSKTSYPWIRPAVFYLLAGRENQIPYTKANQMPKLWPCELSSQ